MRETKAGKYGRNLAVIINYIIGTMPEKIRRNYRQRLAKEVSDWRFNDELEGIDEIEITNPGHLGRLIKQSANLMYNKNTGKNALDALLK